MAYIAAAEILSGSACSRSLDFLGQTHVLPYFNAFTQPMLSLSELQEILIAQIERTLQQAGWQRHECSHIPLFIGSTAYSESDQEMCYLQHQAGNHRVMLLDSVSQKIQEHFNFKAIFSFATSCTSSAQAIIYAVRSLMQNNCDKALVLGFEAFNRLTFEHFYAMQLLAESFATAPFTGNGMVLGEGSACLALQNQKPQNQAAYVRMLAPANLSDNHSLTANHAVAIRHLFDKALHNAGCLPTDIDAVKLHAVGGIGDHAEAELLREMFSDAYLFAPKNAIGHTLGASGALETAWLMQQLHSRTMNMAADISNNYKILNYFLGFGGSLCAWVTEYGCNE